MKIVHITPAFYPSLGGIEDVVMNQAVEQLKQGHQVRVVVSNPGITEEKVCTVDGVDVSYLPVIGNRFFGLIRGLVKHVGDADIVHAHDPQVSLHTMNALRCKGPKLVLNTHGGFWHTKDRWLAKKIHEIIFLPQLLKGYSTVIADSESDAVFFRKYCKRVVMIENGVNVEKFKGIATPKAGLKNWLYWGRLSKNKRLDSAIRLLGQMKRTGAMCHLSIAGADFSGESSHLVALVDSLGLKDDVTFHGPLELNALKELISESDLFVTASEYEGFGVGIVEALSSGLPALSRNIHPINRFVVDGVNGCHIAFDESDTDVAKLSAFLSHSQERIAEMSLSAIDTASRYAWDKVSIEIEQLYKKVMAA